MLPLLLKNNEPLRFNTENTAHYITDYQGELLDAIVDNMASLDNLSKQQILQERRLLAESGVISYASLLPVIEKLTQETSYLVVSAVSSILQGLSLFVDEGTEVEAAYKKLLVTFNQFNFERLGFEPKAGEADEDEMVRQLVISNMIKGMMPKQAPKQVKSMQPMQRISASFQPLFVCKS